MLYNEPSPLETKILTRRFGAPGSATIDGYLDALCEGDTEPELQVGLERAGLRTAARDESLTSPYRYSREVFLRLERVP